MGEHTSQPCSAVQRKSPSWWGMWPARPLSSMVICTKGFFADEVAWQMVTLCPAAAAVERPASKVESWPVPQPAAKRAKRAILMGDELQLVWKITVAP